MFIPQLPKSITLVAVSKMQKASLIRQAYDAGLRDFGENYVQEFLQKYDELKDLTIRWHFIGHLQKRKIKDVVGKVVLIHSVDSLECAQLIDKKAKELGIVQACLIQLNIGDEESKSGIKESKLPELIKQCELLKNIEIKGLMIIPPPSENPENTRPYFKKLKNILDALNQNTMHPLTELSMGMSHDYPIAIEEGATLVRIGTAIFGERK